MTFANFKKYVLAYIKRTSAAMTVDSLDCLAIAINSARKYSERLVDFENCRTRGTIVVDLANGADISDVKTMAGAALSVKSIKAAYVAYDANHSILLDLISRNAHLHSVGRQFATTYRADDSSNVERTEVPAMSLVRMGTTLYLSPNTGTAYNVTGTTVTVGLDVIKWLPDYAADGDTDFLLEHCYDYMTLRSVQMLNAFLKEDVRIPISAALLEQAWKTVRVWDAKLLDGAQDVSTNLD